MVAWRWCAYCDYEEEVVVMAVSIKFGPEGVVSIDAQHSYEALYCAYALGRYPPVAKVDEIKKRMVAWAKWLELEIDLGEDDDGDGGVEAKGDGA